MSDLVRVEVDADDGVATVTLDHGKVNAITPDVSKALEGALRDLAERDEARAIVLAAARDGVFSAGFDLATLADKDRAWMEGHLEAYVSTLDALDDAGKPVVAAVNGHAIAGGAILTLPADFRIMEAGRKFGITEIDLGVPVPAQAVHLLARFAPPQAIRRLLLRAQPVPAEEALDLGLVDEVAPEGETRDRAHALARELAAKPRAALTQTRYAIQDATHPPRPNFEHANRAFLDAWFSDEAQARLRKQLERLAGR